MINIAVACNEIQRERHGSRQKPTIWSLPYECCWMSNGLSFVWFHNICFMLTNFECKLKLLPPQYPWGHESVYCSFQFSLRPGTCERPLWNDDKLQFCGRVSCYCFDSKSNRAFIFSKWKENLCSKQWECSRLWIYCKKVGKQM